jgi:hypothetical protein
MAKQNYRQAKKQREAARKVRQQQKIERKLNRNVVTSPITEAPAPPVASGTEEVP